MAVKTVRTSNDRRRLSTLSIPALGTPFPSHTQKNRKTRAGKSRISLIALLAMLSITCNFGGLLPVGSGSTEISGPILAMVPGTSVDENGAAVDPTFTFDPSVPQIAVVVQVGKLDSPAPMTVTWVQVTDQGDQQLFTDTVQVSPFDQAYSIGKNPGTLADGDYKIVAALNGQTQQIELSVAQPSPDQTQWQSQAATSGTTPTPRGQPPVSGGSGSIPRSTYQPLPSGNQAASSTQQPFPPEDLSPGLNGASLNGCSLQLYAGDNSDGSDSTADRVDFHFTLFSCDAATVQVSAAVDGSPQFWHEYPMKSEAEIGHPVDVDGAVSPCSSSGRSDLPTHHVIILATVTSGMAKTLHVQVDIPLGKDTTRPTLDSPIWNPAPAQKVRLGQVIKVTVTAKDEKTDGGSWQSGVFGVHLKDNYGWTREYDGPFAKACDQEKGIKDHVFLYTMPNKPSVELCAQARDNAYNYTEESCVTYYTGDHWEGTIDGTGERNDPSMEHAQVEYHATLQFTVDKYGYILGDGVSTFSNAVGETCTNPNSNKPEHPFTVSGTATANHLEIKLQTSAHDTICSPYLFTIGNNKTVTVPITGPGIAEGEGVISDGAPYISGTYTIRLTCKNCQ